MLTNETVIQAHEALLALIKADKEEHFSIAKPVRMALARNFNKTIPVIDDFSKQHNALVAKYGQKTPKGDYTIQQGTEGEVAFKLERNNLLNSESPVDSLEDIASSNLPEGTPIDIIALLLKTGVLAA